MKLHEKLLKLRKEHNYSQEQLADLLNVSRQTISKWENGTITPTTDRLQELCKIYEISLSELLGETETAEAFPITNQPPKKSGFLSKIDKRIWIGGGILAFVLLIGLIMLIAAQSFMLQRQINKMQSKINWLESSVQEVWNNSKDIQYIYPSDTSHEASLLNSSDIEYVRNDIPNNAVIFKLSATPKAFHENDIGEFVLKNGTESQTISAELKDGTYQAELSFPRDSESTEVFFKINNGNDFKTECISTLPDMFGPLKAEYYFESIPSINVSKFFSNMTLRGFLDIYIAPSRGNDTSDYLCYPTSGTLRIKQNDTVLKEIPLEVGEEIDRITKLAHENKESLWDSTTLSVNLNGIGNIKLKNTSDPVCFEAAFIDNWGEETIITESCYY